MTRTNHPPYPSPSIREVVCEIHFRLADEWKASIYSRYFEKIADQFSNFEPFSTPTLVSANAGTEGATIIFPLVMRYQHSSRQLLLQLSENRLVINVLPVYPGWQQVIEDIRYAWGKLCEVVEPTSIERIGLRYINAIARSAESETLSKWLKPNDYAPTAVLQAPKGFMVQVSKFIAEKDRIIVRLSDQSPSTNDYGTFIFDIDRITEQNINPDENSLLENAIRLHDDVWEVFSSAKSEDLERLLQGEFL